MPQPGWKAKTACLLYETLAVCAIVIVGLVIPHTLLGAAIGAVSSERTLVVHLFILLLAYFVWQWLHGGQTLAMKTWGIRLVNSDGHPLRPAQALLRYALCWPGTLLFGAGFLWALLDSEGRYLHDRLSGTRLTRSNGSSS